MPDSSQKPEKKLSIASLTATIGTIGAFIAAIVFLLSNLTQVIPAAQKLLGELSGAGATPTPSPTAPPPTNVGAAPTPSSEELIGIVQHYYDLINQGQSDPSQYVQAWARQTPALQASEQSLQAFTTLMHKWKVITIKNVVVQSLDPTSATAIVTADISYQSQDQNTCASPGSIIKLQMDPATKQWKISTLPPSPACS